MQNSNACGPSTSEIRERKRILVPMSKPRLYIFTLENISEKKMRNGLFLSAHEFWRFRPCSKPEGKGSMIQNNCCFPHHPENVWLSSRFPSSWASIPAAHVMLGEHMAAPPRAAALKKTALLLFLHNKDKKCIIRLRVFNLLLQTDVRMKFNFCLPLYTKHLV